MKINLFGIKKEIKNGGIFLKFLIGVLSISFILQSSNCYAIRNQVSNLDSNTLIKVIESKYGNTSSMNQFKSKFNNYYSKYKNNIQLSNKLNLLFFNYINKKIGNQNDHKLLNVFKLKINNSEKLNQLNKINKDYNDYVFNLRKLLLKLEGKFINNYFKTKSEKSIRISALIYYLLNENKALKENYLYNYYKSYYQFFINKIKETSNYNYNLYKYIINGFDKDILFEFRKFGLIPKLGLKKWYKNKIITKMGILEYNSGINGLIKDLNFTNDDLKNHVNGINILIKTLKDVQNQGILNNESNLNIQNSVQNNKIKDIIKFPSLAGIRNLGNSYIYPKLDYHLGVDITPANRGTEMKRNCRYYYDKYHQDYVKQSNGTINYNDCKLLKTDTNKFNKKYIDYKKKYGLVLKLDIKKLLDNGGKCWIGKNKSGKGDYLVGFGNFLICQEGNIYTIYGHLNKENKLFNKKQFNTFPKLNSFEEMKLNQLLGGFYEENYLTFNESKLKFLNKYDNQSIQALPYFLYIPNKNQFRKLNLNDIYKTYKYLYFYFGNSGGSFGKHIHLGVVKKTKNGLFIKGLNNNEKFMIIINKLFGITNLNNKLNLKYNHYWFLSIK